MPRQDFKFLYKIKGIGVSVLYRQFVGKHQTSSHIITIIIWVEEVRVYLTKCTKIKFIVVECLSFYIFQVVQELLAFCDNYYCPKIRIFLQYFYLRLCFCIVHSNIRKLTILLAKLFMMSFNFNHFARNTPKIL